MYEEIFAKLNIFGEEKQLTQDIFDLLLERVFKNLYVSLDKEGKEKMSEIFSSQNERMQEEFITAHLPNIEDVFRKEAEKIKKEIMANNK